MGWIVLGVWAGVAVVAAVLLGACLYDLSSKRRRLTGDLARLAGVRGTVEQASSDIGELQRRLVVAQVTLSAAKPARRAGRG